MTFYFGKNKLNKVKPQKELKNIIQENMLLENI